MYYTTIIVNVCGSISIKSYLWGVNKPGTRYTTANFIFLKSWGRGIECLFFTTLLQTRVFNLAFLSFNTTWKKQGVSHPITLTLHVKIINFVKKKKKITENENCRKMPPLPNSTVLYLYHVNFLRVHSFYVLIWFVSLSDSEKVCCQDTYTCMEVPIALVIQISIYYPLSILGSVWFFVSIVWSVVFCVCTLHDLWYAYEECSSFSLPLCPVVDLSNPPENYRIILMHEAQWIRDFNPLFSSKI